MRLRNYFFLRERICRNYRRYISREDISRLTFPSSKFTSFLIFSTFIAIDVYTGRESARRWWQVRTVAGGGGDGIAAAWSRESGHVLRSRTRASDTERDRARDFVRGPTVGMPRAQSWARATYRRVAYRRDASRLLSAPQLYVRE